MIVTSQFLRVIPLPNGRTSWLINGGYYTSGDPPRRGNPRGWSFLHRNPGLGCNSHTAVACSHLQPEAEKNEGEVENGCISNIGFFSFRVVFHFHDYGRKGKSQWLNRSAALVLVQAVEGSDPRQLHGSLENLTPGAPMVSLKILKKR